MYLSDLLNLPLSASHDCSVSGLTLDSRTVQRGDVFLAIAGTQTHGAIYIEVAVKNGAIAIVKEVDNISNVACDWVFGNIPCISVPNLTQQLGDIAARFYGHSSQNMQIIGVTGTNGKTSITHFIAQILHNYAPCGLLGTLGYGIYSRLQAGLHTTPDALKLQKLFAELRQQAVRQIVMEVSSHALEQRRVNGIMFDTAIFTNLSRDHLDYHKTMEAYAAAKQRLFNTNGLKTAIINMDDEFGKKLLTILPKTVVPLTYSLQQMTADVYAKILEKNTQGCYLEIHTPWGIGKLHSPLLGQFNVSNLLAALTALLNNGLPFSDVITQLSQVKSVAGRMERFGIINQQPTVIIDYAHTPDALEKTLLALREHCEEKQLWCVFGCGGNRDKGKRPLMGKIAQQYADKVIITDDNPRHESSQAIIDDIMQGCPNPALVTAIPDRRQAIQYALQHAQLTDMVLIAGKGHEDYQQIGDERLPLSDRQLVSSYLQLPA